MPDAAQEDVQQSAIQPAASTTPKKARSKKLSTNVVAKQSDQAGLDVQQPSHSAIPETAINKIGIGINEQSITLQDDEQQSAVQPAASAVSKKGRKKKSSMKGAPRNSDQPSQGVEQFAPAVSLSSSSLPPGVQQAQAHQPQEIENVVNIRETDADIETGLNQDEMAQNHFPESVAGGLITAAALMFPVGTVLFFVLYCNAEKGKYDLNSFVEVTTTLKVALTIHGIYFVQVIPGNIFPGMARKMFAKMPPMAGLSYPERTGNLFWMMAFLCSEFFFVCATFYFVMCSREKVPRWTLILPWSQCAYNMKNDLLWVGFGPMMSPESKRITAFINDWVLIGSLFIIYIHHFFTADAVAPPRG